MTSITLQDIPNAFHLPRPNWAVIRAWVEANVPEQNRRSVWGDIAEQWLDCLNEALGGAYVHERLDDVVLFAPRKYPESKTILRFTNRSLSEIRDLFGDMAGESWVGPLVVMLFESGEAYYTYINQFFSDGEFGGSGGMCLTEGYTHIVLHPSFLDGLQLCIVHEMTHACLAHINLPLWLEEGLTQYAEQALYGSARANLEAREIAQMREHWRKHGLAKFWWGDGFFSPDEEQQHSYLLAAILFRLLVVDHGRSLPALVRHAHAADAGDRALRETCNLSAADLARQSLGSGEWEPEPQDCRAYCRRGAFYFDRADLPLALSDLNRAIEIEPRFAESYYRRGICQEHLGQFEAAIEDFSTAVQLDSKDFNAHHKLAWLLATCADEQFRNSERALDHANLACELSHFSTWYCLGSLAAAHAEAGDFDEAQRWAKESLRFAPDAERGKCQAMLRRFQES